MAQRHSNCNRYLEDFPFEQQHLPCAVCQALDESLVCLGGSHPRQQTTLSDTVFDENVRKLVDEHVDKKMKAIPGKHSAVFPLYLNHSIVGTAFAFHSCRVLTARRNLCDPADSFDTNTNISIQIGTEMIDVVIESSPNPSPAHPILSDSDDWVILKRRDNISFRMTIIILPSDEDSIRTNRPHITIYHFPVGFQATTSTPCTVISSTNRLVSSYDGKLNCNDFCNIAKGSCGGPYVDNVSGAALGFHIEGLNGYDGKAFKGLSEAVSLVPAGLHFLPSSTLINELRAMRVVM